jgi:hypothetical protein
MGNTKSNILERLDDIASDYILGADFNTLKKMNDKKYCDRVTIVTKDILEKQFSHLDIEYLATRADDGWNIETMFKKSPFTSADQSENKDIEYTARDHVGFIRKIRNPNKPEMCLSISKFYVKIGHIFSAIIGTIKPRYKLSNGEYISILTPKNMLPKDSGVFELTENGFCHKRIDLLRFGTAQNPSAINPQFCNSNTKYNSANDIQGVPELEMLYFDETDSNGNPMMSEKNMSTYRKDLTTFYKRFTDEEKLPNEINKFSDIQLKQYSASSKCADNTYNQPIQPLKDSKENSLFEDYAMNLREMIQVTGDLQQNLVDILNKIFTKKDKENKITIQPKLKMADVDKLIIETRNKLLELYLRCEEYFENGVKIYKAIVNERIINNTYDEFVSPQAQPQPQSEPEIGEDVVPETEGQENENDEDEYVPAEDDLYYKPESSLYPTTEPVTPSVDNLEEAEPEEQPQVQQPEPQPLSMQEPQQPEIQPQLQQPAQQVPPPMQPEIQQPDQPQVQLQLQPPVQQVPPPPPMQEPQQQQQQPIEVQQPIPQVPPPVQPEVQQPPQPPVLPPIQEPQQPQIQPVTQPQPQPVQPQLQPKVEPVPQLFPKPPPPQIL